MLPGRVLRVWNLGNQSQNCLAISKHRRLHRVTAFHDRRMFAHPFDISVMKQVKICKHEVQVQMHRRDGEA